MSDLFEMARTVGELAWCEGRLAEVTGSTAGAVATDGAAVWLSDAALRHGFAFELLESCLPHLDGVDRDTFCVPGALGSELGDALAVEPDGLLDVLAGVVLPRLIVAHHDVKEGTAPANGGPVRRALALILTGEIDAWAEALRLRSS